MKCIQVLPILKHTFSEELTYWTTHDFKIGDLITVTLNKRKIFAIVSSILSVYEAKEFIKSRDFKIKKIEEYEQVKFFSNEFIRACLHTSKYYVRSFGEVLSEYIPKKVLENLSAESKSSRIEHVDPKPTEYIQGPITKRIDHISTLLEKGLHPIIIVPTDAHKKYVESLLPNITVITPIDLYILDTTLVDICVLELAGSEYYRHLRKNFDTRTTVRKYTELRKIPLVEMDSILPVYTNVVVDSIDTTISNTPHIYIIDQSISKTARVKKTNGPKVSKKLPDELELRDIYEKDLEVVSHKYLKLISPELYSLIAHAEKEKTDILLYTVRKGLSSSVTCSDCGHTLICEECKKPYVLKLVDGERSFVCPLGHRSIPVDTACPVCGNSHLTMLGSGTDALATELEDIVSMPITIVDGDSMTQSAARKIFKERNDTNHKPTIYIGTELALHQSLESTFTYSAVASLETLLALPSRIAELEVARVIERLRAKTTHTLLLQTRNPDHIVWKCVHEKNWGPLLTQVKQEAEELCLPPYSTHLQFAISTKYKRRKFELDTIKSYITQFDHISANILDSSTASVLHVYMRSWPIDPVYSYLKSLPSHIQIQVDSPSQL